MPAHKYTPIPLEDEHFSRSYNSGIPSTAPPSFQTVPPSFPNSTTPNRNDESAARAIPQDERLFATDSTIHDDPAISIWAPSESHFNHDLEAAREDTLARLITRVEQIERRLDASGDGNLDASLEKRRKAEEWSWAGWTVVDIMAAVIPICLLIWACAIATLWVASKYRAAGFPQPGSAGNADSTGGV